MKRAFVTLSQRIVLLISIAIILGSCSSTTKGSVMPKRTPTKTSKPVATATATPVAPQTIAEYLAQLSSRGFSGSILVARGDTILASQGYGLADEAQSIPNTPETRFRIGSNTKQFTAMAILILQEAGKLSVSDKLCQYITDCPSAWQPITLKDLLTHTSGISNYTDFSNFPSLIGTEVSVLDLIARFKARPLEFVPGSRWSYSNSGYILLGYIIEKVSGLSYGDFLNQHIFQPLQMHETGYDTNSPPLPTHATGYLSKGNKPVFLDMSEFYAAGAIYSTVGDMYLWDRALMTGKLVSPAALASMFAVQAPCPSGGCLIPTDIGYGYGWFIANQTDQRYIYHWGRIDGFLASNGFYPDSGVVVIVLSNLETSNVWSSSLDLGKLALGKGL